MHDGPARPSHRTLDEALDAISPPRAPLRHGLHSPLYETLWAAHDELAPHLNAPRRPDWPHVAAKLAAKGVMDGKGLPPSGEGTRKTWWKVRWDKRVVAGEAPKRRRRKDAPGSPAVVAAPPPGTQARPVPEPAPHEPEGGDGGDDGLAIRWAVDDD